MPIGMYMASAESRQVPEEPFNSAVTHTKHANTDTQRLRAPVGGLSATYLLQGAARHYVMLRSCTPQSGQQWQYRDTRELRKTRSFSPNGIVESNRMWGALRQSPLVDGTRLSLSIPVPSWTYAPGVGAPGMLTSQAEDKAINTRPSDGICRSPSPGIGPLSFRIDHLVPWPEWPTSLPFQVARLIDAILH